jgi:hypothetical protein
MKDDLPCMEAGIDDHNIIDALKLLDTTQKLSILNKIYEYCSKSDPCAIHSSSDLLNIGYFSKEE